MRGTFTALVIGAALSFGCSKKAAPEPEVAATPEASAKTPGAPAQDDAMMQAALEDLNRKLQQQQYEAAVGALVSMSQMHRTDSQEAQYQARLRQTETELLKKAQAGDPAAQQSAQMLGRMMTGR